MNSVKRFFRNLLRRGQYVGRSLVLDAAFTFRIPFGSVGSITRFHPTPATEPCAQGNTPVPFVGLPCVIDTTNGGVRPLTAGDSGLDAIHGVTVRSFPFQVDTGTNFGATTFGIAALQSSFPVDVLKSGYILVKVNSGTPVKGGRVFIWVAASSGAHVQGGFETVTGGGSNTIELDEKSYYNSGPDATGTVELAFNL